MGTQGHPAGLVSRQQSRLLFVDHVVGTGVELFRAVCEQDMEGVYDPDAPTWVKVENRSYSRAVGRHERFERMRAGVVWRACAISGPYIT